MRLVSFVVGLFAVVSAQAELRVAVVGPMSGGYAVFGEQMRRGLELAVADINAAGGVLGHKLVIEVGDDGCDPKKAVAVAREMANRKVVFVAGHYCSGASIPASDVYDEAGVLQISPASTNPDLTGRDKRYVFRVCGRDDQQGLVAGAHIVRHFNDVNVAILHDNTPYGKGLADETRKNMNKLGKREALYERIVAGANDYSGLVSRLKAANIGLIYLGGYHAEAGLIVRQARIQGLKAVLMSGDALMTDEYWKITGSAGDGTLMTFSRDPVRIPAARPVVERFVQQGWKPEGYTLYTYGAVQVWAQAVQRAGSAKAADVARVMKSSWQFDTVLGRIAFDRNGDVTVPGYIVYRWKDGKYDYARN